MGIDIVAVARAAKLHKRPRRHLHAPTGSHDLA